MQLSVLFVAVPAVYRAAFCWPERNFTFLSTVRACCLVHFARTTETTPTVVVFHRYSPLLTYYLYNEKDYRRNNEPSNSLFVIIRAFAKKKDDFINVLVFARGNVDSRLVLACSCPDSCAAFCMELILLTPLQGRVSCIHKRAMKSVVDKRGHPLQDAQS